MRARRPARTQESIQRKGMLAAAGVGAVFLAVLAWFFARGGNGAAPVPAPPSARARPTLPDQAPGEAQVISSERFRGDIMDRKDPTRRAGELSYLAMDPLPEHRWACEQPEALVFMKDGRTLHIRADKGDLYMPDRQREPEAGTISGNVVAEVYEPRADGKRIEPGVDK